MYGAAYLPRKFKIGIAFPGDNCVDVHTHDLGIVPIVDGGGAAVAHTVLVGGGQGRTHNRPDTYPRLGDALTTVPADRLADVVDVIVDVQRLHGDRNDRRQARLRYLVDRWGLERFRTTLESRLSWRLPTPEPLGWATHRDHLGWHPSGDGMWFLGVPVESGRIVDAEESRLRTGLRVAIEWFRPEVCLTAQQNVILASIGAGDRTQIDRLLAEHGVPQARSLAPVIRACDGMCRSPHLQPRPHRCGTGPSRCHP